MKAQNPPLADGGLFVFKTVVSEANLGFLL
jgi:hypothetical protein